MTQCRRKPLAAAPSDDVTVTVTVEDVAVTVPCLIKAAIKMTVSIDGVLTNVYLSGESARAIAAALIAARYEASVRNSVVRFPVKSGRLP